MPYKWSHTTPERSNQLTLWPYQSLPPRGMAAFVLATFTMITLPLFGLLGTSLLWALLPFLLLAVGSIWFALNRSFLDRSTQETLMIDDVNISLRRTNPRAPEQYWECNSHWVKVHLHENDGPVPNYVTLTGNGREVEIGAFLSDDERPALYSDLKKRLEPKNL